MGRTLTPPHPRPGLGGRPWLTRVSRSDLCPGGGGSRVSLPTPPEDPGARVVAVPPQLRPLPAAQACAAPPPPPHHGQPPRGRHGGRHGVSPPPTPAPPSAAGRGGGGTPGTGVPRPHHGQGPGPTAGGRPGGGREGVGTTAGPVGGGSRPPPSLYLLAALVVGEGGEAGARLHREQHFPEREGPGRAGSQAGPRLTSRPGASLESGLAPRTPGPNAGDGPAPVGVHRAGFPSPPPPPLHSASTPGCGAGGFSRGRTPHTVGRLVRRPPPPPVLPLAPPQGETPSPGPGWTLPRCPSQDVAGVCVCA